MTTVAVVDYGMGNLRSVAKAIEHVAPESRVIVTSDPAFVSSADRVVVPGQGAMPDCMRELDARGLRDAVISAAATKPWLGICRSETEIALMRRLDKRGAICFVDVTTTKKAACPIDRAELLARCHASEHGKLLSGAAAFAAMWWAVPLLRPLGLVARAPMVLAGIKFFYRAFLRVRPRLQRLVATLRPA